MAHVPPTTHSDPATATRARTTTDAIFGTIGAVCGLVGVFFQVPLALLWFWWQTQENGVPNLHVYYTVLNWMSLIPSLLALVGGIIGLVRGEQHPERCGLALGIGILAAIKLVSILVLMVLA